MVVAVPELIELALLLFAFAVVFVSRQLVTALFGALISILEHVPVLGQYLGKLLFTIEQAIANALGSAEHQIDAAIGASWHFLAHYTVWLWDEITGHASLLFALASGLYPIALAIRAVNAAVHALTATHGVTSARVKTLEREYHGIEHQVKQLEREYRGIDATGLGAQLGTLDAEIATIRTQTIPAIQQADQDATSAINNLYDWAKGKASLLGVGTFSVAVAAALGALGLGGLMCKNFGSLLNKWGCGLGSILDGLLGLVVSGLILTNICDVLGLLETAYGDVAGPLISFLTEVPLGGCEVPPEAWAMLAVRTGPLPPPQSLEPSSLLAFGTV